MLFWFWSLFIAFQLRLACSSEDYFNDYDNPYHFFMRTWDHHNNLNLHLPPNGACSSISKDIDCIQFRSCSWHAQSSTCYLAGDTDQIHFHIDDDNENQMQFTNQQIYNIRRREDATYPPGGCDSVKKIEVCKKYSGCYWVNGSGCFTIVTPAPTKITPSMPTQRPVLSPTLFGESCIFPDNGCSSIKKDKSECNEFKGCSWDSKRRKCKIQAGCDKTPPPNRTNQPTIPDQDRISLNDMCKIPLGGCRSVGERDCNKYNGCYFTAGFCTERTCDKFDCGFRRLAFDMAATLLPRCQGKVAPNLGMDNCISQLKDVHDGLELYTRCGFVFNQGTHHTQDGSTLTNLPTKRYYVSTSTGSDEKGEGSFSKPFQTIQKALAISRSASGTPRAIILRAGTYYVADPIVLTEQDSKLTIAPYDNENVILSGAIPLEGIEWKHHTSRILVADVSKFGDRLQHLSSIFFGDKPATRARHPNADPWTQGLFTRTNTGYFDSAESWIRAPAKNPISSTTSSGIRPLSSRYARYSLGFGGHSDIFSPPASYWAVKNPVAGGGCMYEVPRGVELRTGHLIGIPTTFARPTDAYVHAYHVYYWGNWIFRVGSQQGRTFRFESGGFQEARGSCGIGGQQFYIENMLELLDAKNEFYLDTHAKKLYYYPNATNSNPSDVPTAYATVNRRIFHIFGNSEKPVRDVVITGLRIEKTYVTHMDPHEVPSAGDWSITRNTAIFIEGAENAVIHGNSFLYMGGNGVFVSNYARNVKITANRFKHLGASAVLVVGDPRFNTPNPWEMLDPNHPFDTLVEGNIMSEIGNIVKQSSGFFQALGKGSIVLNNIIFNVERAAVNFNDGYGGNNKVLTNLMFNTVRSTLDHGPFNTWDRQPYIQAHEGSNFEKTGEPMMSFVKGNYLIGGYGGIKGIDHDDGSTMWDNSENLLIYTYQKLKGRNIDSHHNIVLFPVETATLVSEPIGATSSKMLWHDNRVVVGSKASPYAFGSEANCLRSAFQAYGNQIWSIGQFWAHCDPSNGRTWDQWRSEKTK